MCQLSPFLKSIGAGSRDSSKIAKNRRKSRKKNILGLWLPTQVRPEYKLPVPRRPVPDYSRFADRPRWLNDGLPVEPGKHGAHGLINVPRCACGAEGRRREPTTPELSPLQLPPEQGP